MYTLILNDKLYLTDKNINTIIIQLNVLMSNGSNWMIKINNNLENEMLNLESHENNIILKTDDNIKLDRNDIHLLPFLLFNDQKICKFTKERFYEIISLCPDTLVDIFTYKCMIDPYTLLVEIFKINKEYIHQAFILYLNKTINSGNDICQFNYNVVIKNFFVNSENYPEDFNKLFMFYLKARQIYPFMINYNLYSSKFNIN